MATICKRFIHYKRLIHSLPKGTIMRIKAIAVCMTASLALPLMATNSFANDMVGAANITNPVMSAPLQSTYSVQLNKTQIVYLPEPASAVVVGNPDIADISIHSSDTIFIVGRGYGETNIIVLNNSGHTVMNADVRVSNSGTSNNVRVFSGGSAMRMTYNCAPQCQPAPMLGDDAKFIAVNKTKAREITNTFASGSNVTRSQTIGSATETQPGRSSNSVMMNRNEN